MEVIEYSWNGKGTKEEPFLLTTKGHMRELSDNVRRGKKFHGQYFRVDDDICLEKEEWIPIGSNYNPFCGNVDGNQKEISGLHLSGKGNGCGLFGCIGVLNNVKGVVENLKVLAEDICLNTANTRLGILVGENKGMIQNCSCKGKIKVEYSQEKGDICAGQIAGINYSAGIIISCVASGEVIGQNAHTDLLKTGGLVGWNMKGGEISACTMSGEMSGWDRLSGICGYNDGKIMTCINKSVMRMEISQMPACLYAVTKVGPAFGTCENNCSAGSYMVIVTDANKNKTTLRVGEGKEQVGMEKKSDIIIRKRVPLYLGKGDDVSYRSVTIEKGGYIKITDDINFEAEELEIVEKLKQEFPETDLETVQAVREAEAEIIICREAKSTPPKAESGIAGGNGYMGGSGGNGGSGTAGRDGEAADSPITVTITIQNLKNDLRIVNIGSGGGAGQDGGNGGAGGNGGVGVGVPHQDFDGRGGNGGAGGNGGSGAAGGYGNIVHVRCGTANGSKVSSEAIAGKGGVAGKGGTAGRAGLSADGKEDRNQELDGTAGERGQNGQSGRDGSGGMMEIEVNAIYEEQAVYPEHPSEEWIIGAVNLLGGKKFLKLDLSNPEHESYFLLSHGGKERFMKEYPLVYAAYQKGKEQNWKADERGEDIVNCHAYPPQVMPNRKSATADNSTGTSISVYNRINVDLKQEVTSVQISGFMMDVVAGHPYGSLYRDFMAEEIAQNHYHCELNEMKSFRMNDIREFTTIGRIEYINRQGVAGAVLVQSESSLGSEIKNIVEQIEIIAPKSTKRKNSVIIIYKNRKGSDHDYSYEDVDAENGRIKTLLPLEGTIYLKDRYIAKEFYKKRSLPIEMTYAVNVPVSFGYSMEEISYFFHKLGDHEVKFKFPDDWKAVMDSEKYGHEVWAFLSCPFFYTVYDTIDKVDKHVPFCISSLCELEEGESYYISDESGDVFIPPIQYMWGCFSKDTQIRMADGSEKNIAEIQIGDWVWVQEGQRQQVMGMITGTEDKLVVIEAENGAVLKVTDGHPILTKRGVVQAKELNITDDLVLLDTGYTHLKFLYSEFYGDAVYCPDLGESHILCANGLLAGDFHCQNHEMPVMLSPEEDALVKEFRKFMEDMR